MKSGSPLIESDRHNPLFANPLFQKPLLQRDHLQHRQEIIRMVFLVSLCLNLVISPTLWGSNMARPEGFEPPTAWFVARYSIQLSYERVKGVNTNKFLINCNPKSVFDLFFLKES